MGRGLYLANEAGLLLASLVGIDFNQKYILIVSNINTKNRPSELTRPIH